TLNTESVIEVDVTSSEQSLEQWLYFPAQRHQKRLPRGDSAALEGVAKQAGRSCALGDPIEFVLREEHGCFGTATPLVEADEIPGAESAREPIQFTRKLGQLV